MTTAQKRALQQTLGQQGYAVNLREWPRKATYYKQDGTPMPNLPADPMSMERYLSRGFTLMPPSAPKPMAVAEMVVEAPVVVPEPPVAQHNPLECVCGFVAKTKAGLSAHDRKHSKEKS